MARLTTDEKKKITSLAEDAKKNNNTTLHFDDIFRFELNNLSKDVCCKDIASKEGEARTLYEDVFERYKPPKTVFRKIQNKLRSLVGRSSVEQSLPGRSSVEQSLPGRSLASRPAGSTPSVNGTNTKRSSILENSIAFATAAAKLREQKQKASSSKKGGKKTKKQKTRRSKKTKRKTRRKKN